MPDSEGFLGTTTVSLIIISSTSARVTLEAIVTLEAKVTLEVTD